MSEFSSEPQRTYRIRHFLSLCFRLHVLEQFLSREVLVECHASLIDSTEPKYTIDTIKTGLH